MDRLKTCNNESLCLVVNDDYSLSNKCEYLQYGLLSDNF